MDNFPLIKILTNNIFFARAFLLEPPDSKQITRPKNFYLLLYLTGVYTYL